TSVVHLAALCGVRPSIGREVLYSDVNVTGTARLLELVRTRRVPTFVFASSSSVYGNNKKVPFSETDPVDHPISPYAATKKAGELLCHSSSHVDGVAAMCLRFFTAYGPRQRSDLAIHKFSKLLAGEEPVPMFGDGFSSRDYTYIDDIVAGVVRALDWAEANPATCEVVNLGRGQPIMLSDMIRILGDAMEVTPEIVRLPSQPGDVTRTLADVTKAHSLLGYDPKVEFEEGIRRFLEWFRESQGS
ncbi:MAG: GDP-mannose 4,6-dehydratase, partial [Gemmatimonadota bacterium]